jgi:tetratricopeptide (TPR) repeat protein
MKRIKLLGVIVVLLFTAQTSTFAQDSTYLSNEYAKSYALFNTAQRYNDASLMKQALVEMIILNPTDTALLRDLAELYYSNRQFVSSAIVAQDINKIYPNSPIGLEIQALSFQNLKLYDRAVEMYEQLWLYTEDNTVLFQTAYLQYTLQRYDEAKTNMDILESKSTQEDTIQLNKSDGTAQEVKLLAGIENVRGLIALEQGSTDQAKVHFNKAIELSPDFEAPKKSLEGLK